MTAASLSLLISAAAYLGFQWTIRTVVYPQFAAVPNPAFAEYERNHQRLLVRTVGPLFVAIGVSSVLVVPLAGAGVPIWLRFLPVVLVAALLAITGFGAVPLHRRLADGFDPAAHRGLLRFDSLRLLLAIALTVASLVLVVR